MTDSFLNFNQVFPFLSMIDIGVLLLVGLILFIIRTNVAHAREVEDINSRLKATLLQKRKREEDLLVLNRTLHEMNRDLEFDNIIEAFVIGATQIFGDRAAVGVYLSDSQNPDAYILSNSIRSEQFKPILSVSIDDRKSTRGEELVDVDCECYLKECDKSTECINYRIEAYGRVGLIVFVKSQPITSSEKVIFQNLIKHLNSSLQNASLLMKVEDTNKSKTAFLANMSHEIRTPLNALMGFSQMIAREDLSLESKQQLSQSIIKNGEQLMRIVDDILDLSKAEAGKLVVLKNRVSLENLIDEVRSVMSLRAESKKIFFSIEAVGRVPETILTDSIRLKQILMNLIGNAIKFTDRGHVRMQVIHSLNEKEEHQLIFKIEDTGIGIPSHLRSSLFQPFSQGDNSYTRRFGGAGLGLAISRRLATELGGDLTLVSSAPGTGSTFQLRVDVGDCSEAKWCDRFSSERPLAKIEQIDIKNRLKEKKILLVEDSIDNQDFFTFYLHQAGSKVTLADNGLDAVKLALNHPYDVILMDIQLPGIDGKEATRRIRAKTQFHGPIIALTAHALLAEKEECLLAGCTSQISKPVSGESLVLGIEKVLSRGEYELAD